MDEALKRLLQLGTITQRVTVPMNLSQENRITVFRGVLEELKQGMWIENGKVYIERATSHKYDEAIGLADDSKFRLLRAIIELEQALQLAVKR